MVLHRISSWVVDLQLFMTSSRGQNLLLLKMGRDHIFNGVLIPLNALFWREMIFMVFEYYDFMLWLENIIGCQVSLPVCGNMP